ncbi:MAG: hypothetical protein PHT62_10280 [Desulfotomaculaceae bacterium]|nr:hypothetical protein [Desulfotomaculaceae bacterium]
MYSKVSWRQGRFLGLRTRRWRQANELLPRTGKASDRWALGTAELEWPADRRRRTWAWRYTYKLLARASKAAQDAALGTAKLERSARLAKLERSTRLSELERSARLPELEGTAGLLELEGSAGLPELEGATEEDGTCAATRWETWHIAARAGKGEAAGIRRSADIAPGTCETGEAGTGDFGFGRFTGICLPSSLWPNKCARLYFFL